MRILVMGAGRMGAWLVEALCPFDPRLLLNAVSLPETREAFEAVLPHLGDDCILAEVLFNPYTVEQIERINAQLCYLTHIIQGRDLEEMETFLKSPRKNIG